MKKIFVAVIASLSILSCKKEAAVASINHETGKPQTETAEMLPENIEKQEIMPAVKDSAGVYHLNFKLEKGKTYPFVSVQKDVSTVSVQGQSASGTQETTDEMSFTVNDFSNGVYDLTLNLISKKISVTQDGKTTVIDTRQAEPKDEQAKMAWNMNRAFAGGKLNLKMKDNGGVVSVKGFEEIYKKVNTVLSTALKENAELKKSVFENFKQSFSEASMKEMLEKNMKIFPAKGVKIGESWSESENISPDGKLKLNTTYTLAKVENATVVISIKGSIPAHTEKQTQNGITATAKMQGTQSGTLNLDKNTGWMKKSTMDISTSQSTTYTDGNQSETQSQKTQSSTTINP